MSLLAFESDFSDILLARLYPFALLNETSLADLKPLKGRDEARLRVGDYRVILKIDAENKQIVVTKIGSRGDVYK
jgi:mRNA interferase RelE/StbE